MVGHTNVKPLLPKPDHPLDALIRITLKFDYSDARKKVGRPHKKTLASVVYTHQHELAFGISLVGQVFDCISQSLARSVREMVEIFYNPKTGRVVTSHMLNLSYIELIPRRKRFCALRKCAPNLPESVSYRN